MSALAQRPDTFFHLRPLSELEATHLISRTAAKVVALERGLDALAAAVLRINGLREIRIEEAAALESLTKAPLVWRNSEAAGLQGAAVAAVRSGSDHWGTLRLEFDLQRFHVDSPVRLAQFAGEQFGGILTRFALEQKNKTLATQVSRFQGIVATRKAFDRAKGIIARRRGIPEKRAAELLREYSREYGRGLREVADAIVFDEQQQRRAAR